MNGEILRCIGGQVPERSRDLYKVMYVPSTCAKTVAKVCERTHPCPLRYRKTRDDMYAALRARRPVLYVRLSTAGNYVSAMRQQLRPIIELCGVTELGVNAFIVHDEDQVSP